MPEKSGSAVLLSAAMAGDASAAADTKPPTRHRDFKYALIWNIDVPPANGPPVGNGILIANQENVSAKVWPTVRGSVANNLYRQLNKTRTAYYMSMLRFGGLLRLILSTIHYAKG